MTGIWNSALHVLNTMPWPLAVFLIGWVGSIGVTHPFKVGLRRLTRIKAERRGVLSWLCAVLSAFAFALWAALVHRHAPMESLLVAAFTGIWSPLAFAALQRFLRASPEIGKRKGFGWLPDLSGLADLLSGDVGPSKAGDP